MRATIMTMAMLTGIAAAAQPQYDNWYFGQFSAVDMGATTPTLLPNGAMSTAEGVASISDAGGALLFYTNGVSVWDRTHAQMPNGFGLFGQSSSSQSVLAVPDPGDTMRYYLFTTPALMGEGGQLYSGLSYSIVDMRLNNELGDVVLKNVPLVPMVTEKLTATRHANGRDAWVVVHTWNTATYYAYPVTCAGVGTPVVSTAGRVMDSGITISGFGAIGCMQFNPAGNALAATWGAYDPVGAGVQACVDLVWFDNSTGQFTDGFSDTHAAPPANHYGYGVCFSASGQRLYTTDNGGVATAPEHRVWQYDMNTASPELSETVVLSTGADVDLGTLQRASDGRIYIACSHTSFLGRIDQPEALGTACGVTLNAVDLGVPCGLGLPNNWDGAFPAIAYAPIGLRDTTVCNGTTVTLAPSWPAPPPGATYLWSTGATTPTLDVTTAGTYGLQVQLPCTTLADTAHVTFGDLHVDLGPDRSLCLDDSLVLRIQPHGASVLWSDGGTDSTYTALTAGAHWVVVADDLGCMGSDTVRVTFRDCTCPFFLPNAFTPDGDRINDAWGPAYACDLLDYELAVFDRWGHELLRTQDPTYAWDGAMKERPGGTFTYTLTYSWWDGGAVQRRRDKGHVQVVR